MRNDWIVLNDADNVAVVVQEGGLAAGAGVPRPSGLPALLLRQDVPLGHKFALRDIAAGAPVLKFGHAIGVASCDIWAGEHVHVHNVSMPSPELLAVPHEPTRAAAARRALDELPATFLGYQRASGAVGTRNYVVVVSSVNCSATVTKAVCRKFADADFSAQGIDGVVPITHASGCAQAIGGLNYRVLNRTLAGWIFHPNVVGAVVIGLGCEGTTLRSILAAQQELHLEGSIPIETLNIQDHGGTAATIKAATAAVERLLASLPRFERQPVPVAQLRVALNCGGSDAFSSLTANPVLGGASDILVARGGAVALAEIPECHGCEDLLAGRAQDGEVERRLRGVFSWWAEYADRHQVTLNENLAPGNIAGGITTIVEKSLGAVTKGGTSPLVDVVEYAEPVRRPGLTLMNTPGFDPVSVTGLVAGGCNLVCFTTGRGSVYGCAIAPTIKIATTTALFERMRDDMDFDAGRVLRQDGVQDSAALLYQLMVEVASGRRTASEEMGLGWEEFAPWPIAETL